MSDIPRIPISLGFSTNEQEAIKLLEKTFNKLQSKLDGETITYNLKCDESKLKNTLKDLQKLGIKDLKIQVDDKEVVHLQSVLSDIIKEANSKGISIKINGLDENKVKHTIQSLKELNELQKSLNKAQLTLDENFIKSNKKDATSQLKQAKEYVNQIRQLEKNGGNIAEFNCSEEGAIAGYKYAKSYMETVRQGIAESRLKSYGITGDIFKDKEEVQLLLSSSEKILKDFSSEYQNVIKKINSTKIDNDITKKIQEIIYYKDLLRHRQEGGLFNESELQEDKDLILFLQQSLEDLIKTKQQAAKNDSSLLRQEKPEQTIPLQNSEQTIKSQEKLQQEIKETNNIIKEQINLNENLNNTQKQTKESISDKKLAANLNIDFSTLESRFKKLNSNISNSGLSSEKLTKSIKEIQAILNKGSNNQTIESIKELREQLKLANAEYSQLNTNANIENKGKVIDYKSIQEAVKAYESMGYAIKNIKASSFTASMKQANGAIETVTVTANKTGNILRATTNIAPFKNLTKEANAFSWVYSGLLKTAQQFLRIYLSPMDFIRYFRNGISILKEYDNALTTISYTMDVDKKKLDTLGENVLQLANDTKTSIKDALAISQIYANMDTTPEKIVELATPTVVLKNLTGADASTTSDQIQAVVQQFGILEEESMHIADVYDYISARVAIDYSKGIENISEAVKVAGSTASSAGLSFEQLSAITAKIAERTRMEGSSIGNGLKTIFTRTSKVGELSDEVDNETLSKASESLHKIGVEVYNLDGSYRKFDTIMQELSVKWDNLTDAERANLSYNIAATRQTNLLSALLETYSDSMQLATEAQQTNGNALANQAKYVESYSAKIQGLSTAMQTFAVHFLNTDSFKVLLDVVTSLVTGIDDLVRNFGALSVVIPVVAITTFVKNFA